MKLFLRTALVAVIASCGASWEACDKSNEYCGDDVEYYDTDGDGYDDYVYGGDDCDDLDAAANPAAPPDCSNALANNNCNDIDDVMECDVDGDGVTPFDGDCNDYDADTYPGAEELCDGVDQDCDGLDDRSDTDCTESDPEDRTSSDTGSGDTGA